MVELLGETVQSSPVLGLRKDTKGLSLKPRPQYVKVMKASHTF